MTFVGRSHDDPYVLFCASTELALRALNRSRLAWTRRLPPSLKIFETLRQTAAFTTERSV
jgi:hypothetical protein